MAQNNWNPSLYDQKHAFVYESAQGLLGLLAPQQGERVLDLGCGTGHLTNQIAESGAGVIGLDQSPQMISAARQQYPKLEFIVADARNFALNSSLDEPFDAIFSNAALHWIKPAQDVIKSVALALKPRGRFVAEFGGKGNVARLISSLLPAIRTVAEIEVEHPWYYPSISEYSALLEQHGLEVHFAALFDRPTKLDGEQGMRNWIEMFASGMLEGLSEAAKQQAIQLTEASLRDTLYVNGEWMMDYRRLRVVAVKTDG